MQKQDNKLENALAAMRYRRAHCHQNYAGVEFIPACSRNDTFPDLWQSWVKQVTDVVVEEIVDVIAFPDEVTK